MLIHEIKFGYPSEDTGGYNLFPDDMETNPNILFHGTSEDNAASIIKSGFKPSGNLTSTSFGTTSNVPLGYACQKRENGKRGAVLAVKFENLNQRGIAPQGDVIYLYDHQIDYKIIAICYVPNDYKFV